MVGLHKIIPAMASLLGVENLPKSNTKKTEEASVKRKEKMIVEYE